MSKPTKLDDAVQARIVEALRCGNTRKTAAAYGGVTPQTLCKWLRKGRKARTGKFHKFHRLVVESETAAIVQSVALIRQAANAGDWRAASWWLARKCPAEWGKRRELEVQLRGQLQHQVENVPVEVAAEDLIAGLSQLLGPPAEASNPPDPPRREGNGVPARPRGPLD